MKNPNEYDNEGYTNASNSLQGELPYWLDNLWNAGARLEDIAAELSEAFKNCENGDLASSDLKVEISGP